MDEIEVRRGAIRAVHVSSVHRTFDTRIYHKECLTLSAAGYDVVLVTPHTQHEVRDGIEIRALPRPRGRLARMVWTAPRAVREALESQGDIYHLHDPELLPWWHLMADDDVPVVYDMHENLSAQVRTKEWLPRGVRSIAASIVDPALTRLLEGIPVVFAEQSYKSDFEWVGQSVTVQNMPMVDRMADFREPSYDRPTVGYIGGVTRDRGSMVTLRALSLLQDRGFPVEWECVGPIDEGHRRELELLRRDLGVEGVRWHGYLPPDEGWSRIGRSHVGLAILRATPNYLASYPTKLFEYMALGLPVVASDVPLYRKVVEEAGCGVLVDPEDPEAVADGIARILECDQEAQGMGRRGRSAVERRYSWQSEGYRLIEFYDELVRASV